MKCPACEREDLRSCVYPGMSTSTLMYFAPYYDEDGNYHMHDSNTHTTHYSCSNGHNWSESSTGRCPSCDLGKDSKKVWIKDEKIE